MFKHLNKKHMKKNFKYLAIAAVASVNLIFTGCSNNEGLVNEDNQQPKNLFLKIENGSSTRTVSDPQTVDPVEFNTGDLYFVAGNGDILQHYALTTTATNIPAGEISLAAIKTGTTISNVPGYTKSVYILGNTPNAPTSGNISAVKALVVGVNSQKDLSEVNLYGSGSVSDAPKAGSPDVYTCTVEVKPTTARLEIPKLIAGGNITAYKVTGIFIDNYYSEVGAGSDVDPAKLVGGSTARPTSTMITDFVGNAGAYPAALDGLYDYETTSGAGIGVPVSKVTTPFAAPSTQVWGYNVLAGTGVSELAKVPRIIIRLTGITGVNGVQSSETKFITVRGLMDRGNLLNNIEAGKVYSIDGGITFDDTNLDVSPNLNINPISVEVSVRLASWSIVSVTPAL